MVIVIQAVACFTRNVKLLDVAFVPLVAAGVEGPRAVEQEGDAVDVLQLGLRAVGHLSHSLASACFEVDGALCAAQRVGELGGEISGAVAQCHVGGYPVAEPVGGLFDVIHTDVEVLRLGLVESFANIVAFQMSQAVDAADGILEHGEVIVLGGLFLTGILLLVVVIVI